MSLTIGSEALVLEGELRIEEADGLHAALVERMRPVDLGACAEMHTAVLGVLLAARPAITRPPADPFLAALLVDLPRAEPPAPAPPVRKRAGTRKRSAPALATAGSPSKKARS